MKQLLTLVLTLFPLLLSASPISPPKKIYHKKWIDFNKNGKKDIYEDPKQSIEKRIEDLLSQMTLEVKLSKWPLCTVLGE